MKKTLLVLAAVAALGLLVVACSGVSPLAPIVGGGNMGFGSCPDFSGTYDIAIHEQPTNGCEYSYLYQGNATLTVTQDGEDVTIVYEDNCYTIIFTGTIDCDGNFEAVCETDDWFDGVELAGNLSTVSGTFADPEFDCDYCTYPWDTNLYEYQGACWCD